MDTVEMPKIKTRLEVVNKDDGGTAKLYLYGVIRQAHWWDDEDDVISAKGVRKKLDGLKGKDINVHINSGGGDVFESIAICNMLKQHDGVVNVYVDAMAGSGASVIATAGKEVFMHPNSMQMIHKVWTYVVGNADDLRKVATDLDKIDASVKASYMSKFIGTEEELEQLVAEETYLTAEECLAFGLCTEIIDAEDSEGVATQAQANVKQNLFAKYRKETQEETKVAKNEATFFDAFKK